MKIGVWRLWYLCSTLMVTCTWGEVSTNGAEHDGPADDHQPQTTGGSGDILPWILKVKNSTDKTEVVLLEEVMGRLEQLVVHVRKVEQLIQNQTVDLQATIKHDIEKMYGDGPQNYEKEVKVEKDADNKLSKNKEPFVFYSDEASNFRFYGDNSSLLQDFEGWCTDYDVVGFGPPKTHAWVYESGADLGAWLKDPLPSHLSDRNQIWTQRRATHVDDRYVFRRYDGYPSFRAGREASRRRQRAWWIHGVGSVLYRGVLHFHYQNHLYSYNPETDARRTQLLMTSDYTRGQHTYVRYHADEHGLFVTYPQQNRFRLMLSRLHPATLQLSETVTLEEDISRVKGVWMICGQVYLLSPSGNSTSGTSSGGDGHVARAVYDVMTREMIRHGQNHDVGLLYGYVSQMTYNPREKVIFGWDNYHLLTWPVVWRKKG